MCLAIPGQVQVVNHTDGSRTAKVSFGGILKEVNLEMVPEAHEGDYVIVHVGVALSVIDEREALRTLRYLEEAGELKDLKIR